MADLQSKVGGTPRPRGFFARRIFQLQHAPRPVFRAVLANGITTTILTVAYLIYDVQVERAIRSGAVLNDARTEAAALVVLGTVAAGSLLTYLVVPQPRADGSIGRSGWSTALGFFASLPMAYTALVIESQLLKPLFMGL
jgi:hypothetical protein